MFTFPIYSITSCWTVFPLGYHQEKYSWPSCSFFYKPLAVNAKKKSSLKDHACQLSFSRWGIIKTSYLVISCFLEISVTWFWNHHAQHGWMSNSGHQWLCDITLNCSSICFDPVGLSSYRVPSSLPWIVLRRCGLTCSAIQPSFLFLLFFFSGFFQTQWELYSGHRKYNRNTHVLQQVIATDEDFKWITALHSLLHRQEGVYCGVEKHKWVMAIFI